MKIYRLVLTVVVFCLMCASVITLSMGWLTNLGTVTPKLPFSAGDVQEYDLFQIYYNNEDDETDPGKQNKVDIDNLGTGLDTTTGTLTLNFDDLQLGNILNLHTLQNENYVFYAVQIPKVMGDTVDLGITYGDIDEDGDHFTIYTLDENDAAVEYTNADRLAEINKIEGEQADTFLSYSFALSGDAPETYTTFKSLNDLFEDEAAALNNVDANGNPVTSEKNFDTTALTGDYYYLYIKLQPNITMYKYFIDHLYDAMPFYLAYEVRVVLSVTPTAN